MKNAVLAAVSDVIKERCGKKLIPSLDVETIGNGMLKTVYF